MENQEGNLEPPGPRTRRASKALEEAKRAEEQQMLDEFPHVMMVGPKEQVRQRAADKVQDEGRLHMESILRGEGGGGDLTIKKEVVEEEEEKEQELDEGRQELGAPQQGDEVGDGDVSFEEEVSEGEEMHEANPLDNHVLAEGQAVAIPTDLLQELEVKDEEQDEGGHLVPGGGGGEGGEQEPILFDDDEEVVNSGQGGEMRTELGENIAAGEGEVDEVVGEDRGEGGAEGGQDEVPGFDEVANSVQGDSEVNVEEDVVAGEGVDESNEDAEDKAAAVEKKCSSIWPLFGLWDTF